MTADSEVGDSRLYMEEIRPRIERGMTSESVSKELGLDPEYVADIVEKFTKPYCQRDGPALFSEVREVIERHYYFEEGWHYVIVSLFVLQSKCALALPAVFYLFFGGAKGSGKSNIIDLLCALCKGVKCENISISALARLMENGKPVFLDEIDADRGKENNEIRDALLRQGYKSNAAPYTRWDMVRKAPEEIPVYGPKAATYRSSIRDDALRDRGFQIPAVKVQGESGYDYVLLNFWPELGDLPSRLDEWGSNAVSAYTPAKLKETAYSSDFKEKVRRSVERIGANRESEIVTTALLVGEMAGIDVVEELRAAVKTREVADEDIADDLEELGEVVQSLGTVTYGKILAEAPGVRIKQSEIKKEMNKRRKERNDRTLSDQKLALLRREIGVKDAWLSKPGNALVWILPQPFLSDLANRANKVNNSRDPDWTDPGVSQVDRVRQLHEDADKGLSYESLVSKYGKDLVDREQIPMIGGR